MPTETVELTCWDCLGDQAFEELHGDEVYAVTPCATCKGHGTLVYSDRTIRYVEEELRQLEGLPNYYGRPFAEASVLLARLVLLRDFDVPDPLRVEVLERIEAVGKFVANSARDYAAHQNGVH